MDLLISFSNHSEGRDERGTHAPFAVFIVTLGISPMTNDLPFVVGEQTTPLRPGYPVLQFVLRIESTHVCQEDQVFGRQRR